MRTIFLLYTILCSFLAFAQNGAPEKPNILVILTDDMGYSDIGCYGSEIHTPNIDKLAADGIRFTHFYTTPRCSPTRASLLTGLYSHQAGMGHLSTENFAQAGYVDDLSKNAVTMAEVFQQAGYATYMTGKWHIAKNTKKEGDRSNWPLQRGFQRFFGTLNGSGSYYDPGTLMSNNTFIPPAKNFYYTNAISDTAVKFIQEHPSDKPFFFYVAFTGAHWPLHAPEEAIKKYNGVYEKGWDEIRRQRFNKLKQLGIIDNRAVLTERSVTIPAWENEPLQNWQVRRMQVYAAMIDIMDQGIGRIITALEKKGILENTVIFYLHDNGGCAETLNSNENEIAPTPAQQQLKNYSADSAFLGKQPIYTRSGHFIRSGKGVMPGPDSSWVTYGEEWANVSNTPFRYYKHWTHEGGIATPLIIHWPKGIAAKGQLRTQPGHLIDIMATCLAITGVNYPSHYNGNEIQPYEGVSLLPAFTNKNLKREWLFWEHEGNRALRVGNWKIVSRVQKNKVFTRTDETAWELYDLEKDPTETNNLALRFPEKVKSLSAIWEQEAVRVKAKPWPWEPSN